MLACIDSLIDSFISSYILRSMSSFTGSITDVVLKQLWLITKSLVFPFNVWITES